MAVVVKAIQSVQLPNGAGDFTLDLIDGAVFLSEDLMAPGSMLALVETGQAITRTRAFALLERDGLISDETPVSTLRFISFISGGQVPRFFFERIVP